MALIAIKGIRGVPGPFWNRCVVSKAGSLRARPFRSTSVRCQAVDDGATGAASVPSTVSAEPAAAAEPVAKAEVRLATQAEATDEVAETMPEENVVIQSIPEPVPASGGGFAAHAIGVGKWVAAAMLAYSIVTTGVRIWKQQTDPRARRMRNVNKNLLLVTQLSEMLPENRAALSKSKVSMIRMKTGFTPVEMFRKYLWFVLRERQFDQDALEDLVALKGALDLTDAQVADALRERAVRIERKYGKVMLNTTGMSETGVERKATARALFSKLLFLTSCDRILPQGSEEAKSVNLRDIFGATEEETEKLRIVSLHEVDLEKLASMPSTGAAESDEADVEQRKDP